MIGRIPVCLHTCLHCRYAVVLEEYSSLEKRLVFDGCWKIESVKEPLRRDGCEKFEESEEMNGTIGMVFPLEI